MGSASGRSFLRNCEALGNASQGEVCGGLALSANLSPTPVTRLKTWAEKRTSCSADNEGVLQSYALKSSALTYEIRNSQN